jgi:hypothetical protein
MRRLEELSGLGGSCALDLSEKTRDEGENKLSTNHKILKKTIEEGRWVSGVRFVLNRLFFPLLPWAHGTVQ